MITLYGLRNCDTCKKALTALLEADISYRFVDIRAEADLPARVPVWLKNAGAKALINTRSTTWRGLPMEDRERAEAEPARLLIENPTLIKRPVIETGGEVFVGWNDQVADAVSRSPAD
jgi:arsenate reductase